MFGKLKKKSYKTYNESDHDRNAGKKVNKELDISCTPQLNANHFA